MPNSTFMNLDSAKKDMMNRILLHAFYEKHISQVTVSEIVTAMGMSRGAFYKYFTDLQDAYTYILSTQATLIHQTILQAIDANHSDYFVGIKDYLIWCASLDRTSDNWKGLSLFILSGDSSANKRVPLPADSPLIKQWLDLLEDNQFIIHSVEEAISFLYFSMNLVMETLADFLVNDWSLEQLLTDYDFKVRWLKDGLIEKRVT